MSSMAVHLTNVSFSYPGSPQKVLDQVSFQVERGQKVFLFGPSGSGKTTLLEMLAGVLVPDSGTVQVLGQLLATMSATSRDQFRADHLGYVFQTFNLIPYLNVKQNITLPLSFSAARRARTQLPQDLDHLLEKLAIAELQDRTVTDLSIGQQQRVAAARALLGRPALILADEPTSALDYDHREKFLKLLFELCSEQQTSLIFVSHDRSLEKLFDRSLSLLNLKQGGL